LRARPVLTSAASLRGRRRRWQPCRAASQVLRALRPQACRDLWPSAIWSPGLDRRLVLGGQRLRRRLVSLRLLSRATVRLEIQDHAARIVGEAVEACIRLAVRGQHVNRRDTAKQTAFGRLADGQTDGQNDGFDSKHSHVCLHVAYVVSTRHHCFRCQSLTMSKSVYLLTRSLITLSLWHTASNPSI